MVRFFAGILLLLVVAPGGYAQTDTSPAYFSEEVRSLRLCINGNDMLPPVIVMGSRDVLEISFDLIGDDSRYLRYELTHCNADWQPSKLLESEFMDGFNQASVNEFRKSSGTTVAYYHYSIEIPNADVRLKLSGNYLLRVYDESDMDSPLLQCRFMITEQSAGINAELDTRTDISYNDCYQQLTVEVEAGDSFGGDLMNDIYITVSQNGREDNKIILHHPSYISGRKAVYDHRQELIFPGGNEYRRFETVSTKYLPMHVEEIGFRRPYYHFLLEKDYMRAESGYAYDSTPKGRFRINEYDSADPDIEADYTAVRFILDPEGFPDGEIYIDSDFTLRRMDSGSRMEYNPSSGCYEKVLLLKQGSYSYQYISPSDGTHRHKRNIIEGDFHQTQNEYFIAVYLRIPGSRYDRLIATGIIAN